MLTALMRRVTCPTISSSTEEVSSRFVPIE
nr:MAG TPA: hypothetical protein [Caudoviricetes sp.]